MNYGKCRRVSSTPGAYYISWVNDDPGGATVYITSEDQVNVNAAVDPFMSFNVGSQPSATACDGTFADDGGTVALGELSISAVNSSDANAVPHVCTRVSTNATSGAIVTVKSLNASLKSASKPTDTIPSATATLTNGLQGYGLCVGSAVGDMGMDTTEPVGASPVAQTPFGSSCTASAHSIGGLTTAVQPLWTLGSPSQNAFARIYLKASASGTTPAHQDYSDTLIFVASGTY